MEYMHSAGSAKNVDDASGLPEGRLDLGVQTHIGLVREENEDAVFARQEGFPTLLIVADGMGGYRGGKLASTLAVETVHSALPQNTLECAMEDRLRAAVLHANDEIYAHAQQDENLRRMGTTLTAAVLRADSVILAHVGDSRAYLFDGEVLCQITKDHSYVQYLVEQHLLTAEEARNHPCQNMITRAVGMEQLEVDVYTCAFAPGQTLLLCTDGLTRTVPDADIRHILQKKGNADEKARALIDAALAGGGMDNISVIVAAYENGGESV